MDLNDTWLNILNKYYLVKKLFIECEESDPELKSNLQPMNEFRASLDHIIKMMWAYIVDNNEKEAQQQYEKLLSHLDRCFFDICDMLSTNYRGKIYYCLERYDVDTITKAIPDYYSEIKPNVEKISQRIGTYRDKKGLRSSDSDKLVEAYSTDVTKLREYFLRINEAQPIMDELKGEMKKEKRKADVRGYVIGGIIGAVGSALVALILHFFGI